MFINFQQYRKALKKVGVISRLGLCWASSLLVWESDSSRKVSWTNRCRCHRGAALSRAANHDPGLAARHGRFCSEWTQNRTRKALSQGPQEGVPPGVAGTCWRCPHARQHRPCVLWQGLCFFSQCPSAALCLQTPGSPLTCTLRWPCVGMRPSPYLFLYFSHPRPITSCRAQTQQCWKFSLYARVSLFH